MPTSVDALQIELNANAVKANDALDKLVGKLDRLTTSLKNLNTSSLTGLANGVQKLGNAMQTMNNIKTTDFNRLVKNVQKMGTIDVSAINSIASSMSHLTRAFNQLGTVSTNAQQVGVLANNLSKLGNKGVQNAITNIPQLATAMKQLMTTLSTAPKVSQNVIQMTNALANLASQGSKVGSASKSIVNGLNRTSFSANKTTKSFNSLASAFGRFYANYFLIVRGLKGLGKSIISTADYIESFNYFDVAMGKIGKDWAHQFEQYGYDNAQSYAESFLERLQEELSGLSGLSISTDASGNGLLTSTGMKNLGLNIQEVTQYASQLASVTNSIGQTGEVSLATANTFTKLGADISSLFNQDYSSVMKNLQSGLIGQSRALYKYGIDITNATLQTYAYDLGLKKAVSEMTQAEKMQLRMIAILDQSKVSWGDLSNTLSSPSNLLRQFTNNLKEAGMVLGQLFIPLLSKVMPVLNGITIAITNLLTSIAGFFGIKIDLSGFGNGFSNIEDDIGGIYDGIDDVTSGLDNATASAKKFKGQLQGFDKLNVITTQSDTSSSPSGGPSGGVGSGIDLTKQILEATEAYQKVWDEAFAKMENKALEFSKKVEKALEPVKQLFKDISIGDWFAVGQDVTNIVVGITDFFSRAIGNVDWEQIGENIGLFIKGIDFIKILSSVGQLIWEAFNASIEQYKGMFNVAPIETAILTGVLLLNFTPLGKIVSQKLAKSIANAVGLNLANNSGITTALFGVGGLMAKTINAGFQAMLGNTAALSALTFINPIITKITGIGSVTLGITTAFSNFFEMLKDGFNWFNEILMVVGIGLTTVGAIILGAPAMWAGVIAGIVAGVSTLVIVVKDNWDTIVEWTSNLFDKVSQFFTNLWEKVKSVWSVVSTWFSENVIEPIVSFFVGFSKRVGQIFEGLWIIVQAIWKIVSTWFNDNVVQPIINFFAPIVEEISSFFTDLWKDIKSVWNTVSNWFNNNIIEPVSSAFEKACDKISGFFTSLWSGIKNGVVSAMNGVIGGIESGINFIVGGINRIIKGFNKIVSWAAKVAEVDWGGVDLVPKVNLSRIPQYQTGGFPEDGFFFANHNELIGEFTNGQTAVANNEQIIAGIERGVERAVTRVLAPYLADIANSSRITANKEFSVGSREVFNAVRTENREYINRNGESAFAF